jgi:hypothetical protein
MKRTSAFLASVAIALSSFLALAPPAAAGVRRLYTGQTSQQDRDIRFRLIHTETGVRLRDVSFDIRFVCEDGTRISEGHGIGWFPGRRLSDGVLAIDDVSRWQALHLHGTFGPRMGSGTLELTIPYLTPDETAQICTSGELSWAVSRVHSSPAARGSSETAETVEVTFRNGRLRLVERRTPAA